MTSEQLLGQILLGLAEAAKEHVVNEAQVFCGGIFNQYYPEGRNTCSPLPTQGKKAKVTKAKASKTRTPSKKKPRGKTTKVAAGDVRVNGEIVDAEWEEID